MLTRIFTWYVFGLDFFHVFIKGKPKAITCSFEFHTFFHELGAKLIFGCFLRIRVQFTKKKGAAGIAFADSIEESTCVES